MTALVQRRAKLLDAVSGAHRGRSRRGDALSGCVFPDLRLFPREKLGLAISVYTMGIFFGSASRWPMGGTVVDAVCGCPRFICLFWAWWRPGGFSFCSLASRVFWSRPGLHMRGAAAQEYAPPRRRPRGELNLEALFRADRTALAVVFGPGGRHDFPGALELRFSFLGAGFFPGSTAGRRGRRAGIGRLVAIFGCMGMYVGGLLCDRWQRRGSREGPLR